VPPATPPTTVPDAATLEIEKMLRSRRYVGLLIIAALLGVPISALAYGFLQLTHHMQPWVFTDLPHGLGFSPVPSWWALIPLGVAGLLVGLIIRYLPGGGGHVPIHGLKAGGEPATAVTLPGIALAAVFSIGLGAVIGPEAPLIALGGGVAVLFARLLKKDLPAQAAMVVAATGSFAAVSTLLGSPIVGAFLLMEISGVAGAAASAALVPGLLGAGVGALVFTGLGRLTGEGTFSLKIPNLPVAGVPTTPEIGWAIVIGLLGAGMCWLIRRLGVPALKLAQWRTVPVAIAVGLAIAGLAIGFTAATGESNANVLYSGQDQLPTLIEKGAAYSLGTLLLLLLCKGLAYVGSLTSFRGGPVFPSLFIGATGGIAMSHLPGLPMVGGVAMGIGAMAVGMLRLPMTSVLLTALFLGSDGFDLMPLIIISVVVAHVATIWLTPLPVLEQPATPPVAAQKTPPVATQE
jgi:H+/Cl- antiporter ClcA